MNYKYISYHKAKDNYQVRIKVGDETITKHTKTLEEALNIRESIFTLYNLDKSKLAINNVDDTCLSKNVIPKTFSEFAEKWLADVKTTNAITTYSNYYYVIRLFNKHIAKVNPATLTATKINTVIKKLNDENDYSVNYNKMFKRVFNAMYKYAIDKKWYKNNPAKDIVLLGHETEPKRPFTDEEMAKFFKAVKEYDKSKNTNIWYPLFELYRTTGARRAEILALHKSDVKLYPIPHISINKSQKYDKDEKKYILGTTKTKSSNRVIPITKELADYLLSVDTDDFIFKGKIGRCKHKVINGRYVDSIFAVIRKRAGIDKHLTLHCFRHNLCSSLVMSNADLATVRSIGGWSSNGTMLNTYTHSNLMAMSNALKNVLHK